MILANSSFVFRETFPRPVHRSCGSVGMAGGEVVLLVEGGTSPIDPSATNDSGGGSTGSSTFAGHFPDSHSWYSAFIPSLSKPVF